MKKLSPVTKWLLFISGMFIAFQLLCPAPGLQPDDPPPIALIADRVSQPPTKIFEVISVAPKFSHLEIGLIQEAANDWQFYTDDLATFKLVSGDPSDYPIETVPGQLGQAVIIRPIDSYEPKAILLDVRTCGDTLGFYERGKFISTIWIIMNRIRDEDEFIAVVMHELGHSIGLDHTTHEGTLMYPYVSADCVTQYDLQKFCNIYGCDSEQMNFCYHATDGLSCLRDEEYDLNNIIK